MYHNEKSIVLFAIFYFNYRGDFFMKIDQLSQNQREALLIFFSGENVSPNLEEEKIVVRGALTNEILYAIPYENALEIVKKTSSFSE